MLHTRNTPSGTRFNISKSFVVLRVRARARVCVCVCVASRHSPGSLKYSSPRAPPPSLQSTMAFCTIAKLTFQSQENP